MHVVAYSVRLHRVFAYRYRVRPVLSHLRFVTAYAAKLVHHYCNVPFYLTVSEVLQQFVCLLSPRKRGIMESPALVCLSVCLSVCYHNN